MPTPARGFTIIELLVVIVILGVLLFVVVANVPRQSNQTGNVQRKADVNALLVAIYNYRDAHNGTLPEGITADVKKIASTQAADTVNLCQFLVPTHLPAMPLDPAVGAASPPSTPCSAKGARYNTGYTVQKISERGVRVAAPSAEGGEEIFASD